MEQNFDIDELERRGWSIIPSQFYLCNEKQKNSDNRILFYDKARILWNLSYSFFLFNGFCSL